MLNTYFGAVVPLILDEGGTVVQFMGDAVMAAFNAPSRQPDHALRAARAALRLQQAAERRPPGAPDWPRFRVGVNPGRRSSATSAARSSATSRASAIRRTWPSRLEQLAEPGQVVIGPATRQLLKRPRARAIHGAGDREGQTGAGRGVRAAWAAGRITGGAFVPTEWPLLDPLPPEERRRLNKLRRLFDALLLGARHTLAACCAGPPGDENTNTELANATTADENANDHELGCVTSRLRMRCLPQGRHPPPRPRGERVVAVAAMIVGDAGQPTR